MLDLMAPTRTRPDAKRGLFLATWRPPGDHAAIPYWSQGSATRTRRTYLQPLGPNCACQDCPLTCSIPVSATKFSYCGSRKFQVGEHGYPKVRSTLKFDESGAPPRAVAYSQRCVGSSREENPFAPSRVR